MSSYESLVGRAILSSDPAERQAAEDAITVKMMVQRHLFCQYTGALLDQRSAVVVEDATSAAVVAGDVWDTIKDAPAVVAMLAGGARVLDGRILFAKPARAKKAKPAPDADDQRLIRKYDGN